MMMMMMMMMMKTIVMWQAVVQPIADNSQVSVARKSSLVYGRHRLVDSVVYLEPGRHLVSSTAVDSSPRRARSSSLPLVRRLCPASRRRRRLCCPRRVCGSRLQRRTVLVAQADHPRRRVTSRWTGVLPNSPRGKFLSVRDPATSCMR